MNPYLRQLKKFTCTKFLIASPKILGPPLLAGGGEEAAGARVPRGSGMRRQRVGSGNKGRRSAQGCGILTVAPLPHA